MRCLTKAVPCQSVNQKSLPARRKRQQSNVAGLLDSRGNTPLVRRANAAQAPRDDLAPLGDELPEQADVFVIDGVNLLHAKLADLLAAEKFASSIAATAAWA